MFNPQQNYNDAYEREKLKILQALNVQIQNMAVKLDNIVSQVEENLLKTKPNQTTYKPATLLTISNTDSKITTLNATPITNTVLINTSNNIELGNNHQLVKIIDEPLNEEVTISSKNTNKKSKSLNSTVKSPNLSEQKRDVKPPDTTAKRNKQQRQFNTFVRESINQLLGPDFMRTHDVQDIDAQVMEMIRKEAVENYLPDNIRPRRAWHLAKASLRTLKRTLNNRK